MLAGALRFDERLSEDSEHEEGPVRTNRTFWPVRELTISAPLTAIGVFCPIAYLKRPPLLRREHEGWTWKNAFG